MATLTLTPDARRMFTEEDAKGLVHGAVERLAKTNKMGGVMLTPLEKNVLSTMRFVRRPIDEQEVAQAMNVKTGYDENVELIRPVLRSLKKHGFVIDLPVGGSTLLWLGIQGDLHNDTQNFMQYRRHRVYRDR